MKKFICYLICMGLSSTFIHADAVQTSNDPNANQTTSGNSKSFLTPTKFPEPKQNPNQNSTNTNSNTNTNTNSTPNTNNNNGSLLQKTDFPKSSNDIPKCKTCGGIGEVPDHGVWVKCPKCR